MPKNSIKRKTSGAIKTVIHARESADAKIRGSITNLLLNRKRNRLLEFDLVLLLFLSNLGDDWLIPMTRQKLAEFTNEKYLRVCASLKRLQDLGYLLVVKTVDKKGIIVSPELLNEGWPKKKEGKIGFWKRMIKLMGKENEPQFSIHC
jgi:hypothetical protein